MTIDSYSFGAMVINGRANTSDLILYPEKIDSKWWRAKSHHCSLADLAAALVTVPKILIIGTGDPGLMLVDDDLLHYCADNGIELSVLPTAQAVDTYNGCPDQVAVIAAFHLTC
jgi:hypothetical protein